MPVDSSDSERREILPPSASNGRRPPARFRAPGRRSANNRPIRIRRRPLVPLRPEDPRRIVLDDWKWHSPKSLKILVMTRRFQFSRRSLGRAASTEVTRRKLHFHRRFVPRDRDTWMERAREARLEKIASRRHSPRRLFDRPTRFTLPKFGAVALALDSAGPGRQTDIGLFARSPYTPPPLLRGDASSIACSFPRSSLQASF
jgi:hypothetical protein